MSINEPYREVAAAILIGTCGRLLLQQREDIPGLLYAGMVGLFGGHREGSETRIETVLREIEEEIGIAFTPDRLEPLHRAQRRVVGATKATQRIEFDAVDLALFQQAVTQVPAQHLADKELGNITIISSRNFNCRF